MDWMDVPRRRGGWLWVGAGVVFQAVALALGWQQPGPITWVLVGATVALAVAAAWRPAGRTTRIVGWAVAVLYALDFAGAVLDRFGVLGAPGDPGVSWGSWDAFTRYTGILLHLDGASPLTAAAAWGATAAESALSVLIVTGVQRRWVGKATAGLFTVYLVALSLSSEYESVARFAMPILVGGALLLSATPASRVQIIRPIGVSGTNPRTRNANFGQ